MKKAYKTAPLLIPFIQKAFLRNTNLNIQFEISTDDNIDAVASLPELQGTKFSVLSKRWLPQANINEVIGQLDKLPKPSLLIADFVNPSMAKTLTKKDYNFIDIAGNARIFSPPMHILVKGNKESKALPAQKEKPSRAFSATGLKVTYLFLCTPNSVNFSYRDIAKTADVALGSVGWVVNDLKSEGFIQESTTTNKNGEEISAKKLHDYRKLLDKWVAAYNEKLRPKLFMGACQTPPQEWWKNIDLKPFQGLWGGSIAAHHYLDTNVGPQSHVYVPEGTVRQLIRSAGLNPSEEGTLRFYKPLWQPQNPQQLVHPVLAFADLIMAGEATLAESLFAQRLSMH